MSFQTKRAVGQVYSGMFSRSLTALPTGLLVAYLAAHPAGVAHATPSDDDGPGPCTIHATPNLSVVCLSAAGSGTQGECASKNGQDPAEVRYPYQPGTTYVVRGQGCASTFVPPYTLCQDFGPTQIAL